MPLSVTISVLSATVSKLLSTAFYSVPRAVKVWDYFSSFLDRLLDSPFVLSSISVFYPVSDVQSSAGVSLSNFLLATVLFWIWNARNSATFRNAVLDSERIIQLIKKDVTRRILCAPLDSKRNLWSFRNVRSSLDMDNQWIFFPVNSDSHNKCYDCK